MLLTFQGGAGSLTRFVEAGDFFRLMQTAAPVTVYFYKGGAEVVRAEGVTGGYAEKFAEGFDSFAIASDDAQDVQFVSRLGNTVSYDAPPVGQVTVINTGGDFAQAAAVVGVADAQLLAANVVRRYLLIQNNDAAGDVFVTLDGSAATVGHGVKIAAGGSLELSAYVPRGAIRAIGSIANNPNVVLVEG